MSLPTPKTSPLARPGSVLPMELAERAELPQNDGGNATRILATWGDQLLYVLNRDWAVWDGTRYAFTGGVLAAYGVAKGLEGLLKEEARWLYENAFVEDFEAMDLLGKNNYLKTCVQQADQNGTTPVEEARLLLRAKKSASRYKFGESCGNDERISKALKFARHLSSATVDMLDADPGVFVVANGQIDLELAAKSALTIGEFNPATRARWIGKIDRSLLPTRASPVTYDPAATCPKWDAFLELALPDEEDRDAFQRVIGYLLYGANPEAACFVMKGPGGNGKSTILTAINAVFGTIDGYAETVDIDMFMVTPQKPTGGHNADEIDLIGGRVYIGTEPDPKDVFSMKKIKSLTGGDLKKSRAAYAATGVKWVPRGVPLMSCNPSPRFADSDEGTRRRMRFIPLNTNFKALPEDLRKSEQEAIADINAELPGILNWMIDGWRDYRRQGLAAPDHWSDMLDVFMEDADPVAQFIEECLVEDPDARVRRAHFNKVYQAWAEEEGGSNWSGRALNRQMKEKGYRPHKHVGDIYWPGLRWNPDKFALVEATTGERPPNPPPPDPDTPEADPF